MSWGILLYTSPNAVSNSTHLDASYGLHCVRNGIHPLPQVSFWVRWEVEHARGHLKNIIVVCEAETPPPEAIQMPWQDEWPHLACWYDVDFLFKGQEWKLNCACRGTLSAAMFQLSRAESVHCSYLQIKPVAFLSVCFHDTGAFEEVNGPQRWLSLHTLRHKHTQEHTKTPVTKISATDLLILVVRESGLSQDEVSLLPTL